MKAGGITTLRLFLPSSPRRRVGSPHHLLKWVRPQSSSSPVSVVDPLRPAEAAGFDPHRTPYAAETEGTGLPAVLPFTRAATRANSAGLR